MLRSRFLLSFTEQQPSLISLSKSGKEIVLGHGSSPTKYGPFPGFVVVYINLLYGTKRGV
jgi:hypothetical protein